MLYLILMCKGVEFLITFRFRRRMCIKVFMVYNTTRVAAGAKPKLGSDLGKMEGQMCGPLLTGTVQNS